MEEVKTEVKEEPRQPSMIEGAVNAAQALKSENERMERNIKQLQELKAFEALGGKSQGAEQVVKPQEISPKDYAKLVLAGKIPLK